MWKTLHARYRYVDIRQHRAGLFERPCPGHDGVDHRRLASLEAMAARNADAASGDAVVQGRQEIPERHINRARIEHLEAGDDREDAGHIADAARDGADGVVVLADANAAAVRRMAMGRLQVRDAVVAGRQAYRAARVAAQRSDAQVSGVRLTAEMALDPSGMWAGFQGFGTGRRRRSTTAIRRRVRRC